ncbi:hypothetical protein V6N12_045178 [Hibiscus sabdariffa]|uniref:Uncharacterized protein n=1 Tax=Hibiscus sabdariffa TaxID=183260 RepID=A0ABR2G219_9ROSI
MNRCFTYSFAQPKQIVRAADSGFKILFPWRLKTKRFAAQIFHDLHEDVMATAARGHALMVSFTKDEERIAPSDAMDIDRLLSSTVVTGWRSRMTVSTQRKMKNKFRLLIAVYFELYVSLEIL